MRKLAIAGFSASVWVWAGMAPPAVHAQSADDAAATETSAVPADAEPAPPPSEPQDSPPAANAEQPAGEAATDQDSAAVSTIPVAPIKPEAPAPAEDETSPSRLDDVMVTATKREKSAREIPVTVHAYSGEELVQRGATNLEEMVKLQPGTTKNGNRVVMRGVATSSLGTYATSEEVGRFFGDVSLNAPSARGSLADLDPFDMQSIEIAKGPQGTLFGGTALAGAVRFVANQPDLSGFSAAARVGLGAVAHSESLQREAALMLNGPLTETLGLRLVGSWRERPGALDDLHSGRKDIDFRDLQQARALASWQPHADFSLDATYLSWAEDQGDLGFTDNPDRYESQIHRLDQPSYMESSLLSVKAEYRWENVSLIAIGSQLKSSWFDIVDLAPALGVEDAPAELPFPVDVSAKAPGYELRLVSSLPSESGWWLLRDWDYLAGVFLLRGQQNIASQIIAGVPIPGLSGLPLPVPLSPAVVALDQRGQSNVEERAFFFDITRAWFDGGLELNLGGRLARSTVEAVTYYVEAGQSVLPERYDVRESRFNPKAALTWRAAKDLSFYGSAAQGFRFGGINGNPTAGIDIPRTFTSDSLWNYELGLRSEWLERTLRLDITGFRIDWTDLQITQVSDTAQNFVSNVGGARILGTEAMVRWLLPEDLPVLPEGLTLAFGGSYIDARITEPFESENGPVDSGTRLPLTPYLLANGGISWTGGIGSWLLGVSLTDAYAGDRKNELLNTVTLPAFHSVGTVIRLSNPSLRFAPELNLSATNLLDQEALNFAVPATTGSNVLYVLNRPRTLLLSVQLNF